MGYLRWAAQLSVTLIFGLFCPIYAFLLATVAGTALPEPLRDVGVATGFVGCPLLFATVPSAIFRRKLRIIQAIIGATAGLLVTFILGRFTDVGFALMFVAPVIVFIGASIGTLGFLPIPGTQEPVVGGVLDGSGAPSTANGS